MESPGPTPSAAMAASRERIRAAWDARDVAALDCLIAAATPPILDHPETGAITVCREIDRGVPVSIPAGSGLAAAALLQALVAMNRLDAARAYVDAAQARFGAEAPGLGGLGFFLRRLPASAPPLHEPFADQAARDVQIVRRPGAAGVLFVFCGSAQRFGAPLNIMHRWFSALPFHLVYLRDAGRMFYLNGIASLGLGVAAGVNGCTAIARQLGAPRLYCMGNSAGVYGALNFGLRLRAEAVLGFSGPTNLAQVAGDLARRQARRSAAPEAIDPSTVDLAAAYRAAGARPRVRLFYGAGNENDVWQAENMNGVPGVETVAVDGADAHDTVAPLIRRGSFAAQLAWLADPGIAAAIDPPAATA